jgi:hypothetical protein
LPDGSKVNGCNVGGCLGVKGAMFFCLTTHAPTRLVPHYLSPLILLWALGSLLLTSSGWSQAEAFWGNDLHGDAWVILGDADRLRERRECLIIVPIAEPMFHSDRLFDEATTQFKTHTDLRAELEELGWKVTTDRESSTWMIRSQQWINESAASALLDNEQTPHAKIKEVLGVDQLLTIIATSRGELDQLRSWSTWRPYHYDRAEATSKGVVAPLGQRRIDPSTIRFAQSWAATQSHVIVQGPRQEDALAPAFLLIASRMWRDSEGYRVWTELWRGRFYLLISSTDLHNERNASRSQQLAADLVAATRQTALRAIPEEEFTELRDALLLRRHIGFQQPFSYLRFLAKRLQYASPSVALAEEANLRTTTREQFTEATLHFFQEPAWQLILPAAGQAQLTSNQPAFDALLYNDTLTSPFLVNIESKIGSPTAAVCLLFGLPGEQPGPPTVERRGIWPFRSTREVQRPWPTRDDAALLWRTLYAQTGQQHPDIAARIHVTLPSPFPVYGADPYGSNQFSAVVLEAESRYADELLFFAQEMLRNPPNAKFADMILEQLLGVIPIEAQVEYYRKLEEQQGLMDGTPAASSLALRRQKFSERMRFAEFERGELKQIYKELLGAGNVSISLNGGGLKPETVATFLNGIQQVEAAGAGASLWQSPANQFQLLYFPDRESDQKSDTGPQPSTHQTFVRTPRNVADEANLLILEAVVQQLQNEDRTRKENSYSNWSLSTLRIGKSLGVLFRRNEGRYSNSYLPHNALVPTLTELKTVHHEKFTQLIAPMREQVRYRRTDRNKVVGQQAFFMARDHYLHGNPGYRQALDAALNNVTPQSVQRCLDSLLETLTASTPVRKVHISGRNELQPKGNSTSKD